MDHKQPLQYFTNDLQPIKVDAASLKLILAELRAAIMRSIDLIQTTYKAPDIAQHEAFGTISYGALGTLFSLVSFLRSNTKSPADPALQGFPSCSFV
jgi:hypothetical protein